MNFEKLNNNSNFTVIIPQQKTIKKMKKIYTFVALTAIAFGVNAQSREAEVTVHHSNMNTVITAASNSGTRAPGDTLMYMPLPGTTVNATDAPTFQLVREDIDALPPNNAGYAMDFGLYYSTDSSIYGNACGTCVPPHGANFYHPWETPAPAGTDTAFFWSATSWFNPAGVADNWLMFGPLTIPATGATLVWYDRTNRYRDGYTVLVADASTASTPLTFTDFDVSSNIFTETDDAYPSATWAVDTTWELKTAVVPASFNGTTAVFAFHHNANDMDVLRLDEITLVDQALSIGIAEQAAVNGVKVTQNSPNPFGTTTKINYELGNSATVVLSVFDVTGKKVAERAMGDQNAGAHTIDFNAADLSAGVYYYSIKANDAVTSTVKMVVIK